jgi:betaine reductase
MIPLAAQASRIVRGVRVEHVCGDPSLSPASDKDLTRRIVRTALRALQTEVTGPTMFEPGQPSPMEAVHAS